MTSIINVFTVFGTLGVLQGIAMLVFPPGYKSFYGVRTEITLKDQNVWSYGQRIFAPAVIMIGVYFIVIGLFHFRFKGFLAIVSLIALWRTTKYVAHKMIAEKFPES